RQTLRCAGLFSTPMRCAGPSQRELERIMLDLLRNFVSDLAGGDKHQARFEQNDYRLAAATLLIHAAMIDGSMDPAGRDKLQAVLKSHFGLDDAAVAELIDMGTQAEQEAVDLYHFTSLINRSLDEAGRLGIVEMMWEIVLADGRVTEFEDNL